MSHGMDPRPIESIDGTNATVTPQGRGDTVIYVMDPEVKEHLGRIRELLEELLTLKKLGAF